MLTNFQVYQKNEFINIEQIEKNYAPTIISYLFIQHNGCYCLNNSLPSESTGRCYPQRCSGNNEDFCGENLTNNLISIVNYQLGNIHVLYVCIITDVWSTYPFLLFSTFLAVNFKNINFWFIFICTLKLRKLQYEMEFLLCM